MRDVLVLLLLVVLIVTPLAYCLNTSLQEQQDRSYQEGYEARQSNAPPEACPYSQVQAYELHRAWLQGWLAANRKQATINLGEVK